MLFTFQKKKKSQKSRALEKEAFTPYGSLSKQTPDAKKKNKKTSPVIKSVSADEKKALICHLICCKSDTKPQSDKSKKRKCSATCLFTFSVEGFQNADVIPIYQFRSKTDADQ